MTEFFTHIHFLRPAWLLTIPLVLIVMHWRINKMATAGWSRHIAKDKLPHLLITPETTATRANWWLLLPLVICCIALAGPSWQSLPGKTAANRQAMVIVFDLSPSMLAQDIKPSRLARARLKLIDLLRTRVDGETALIVYAGDAHRVSPLTDDAAIIEALVPTLHPGIMPLSGSHPERAMELAQSLFSGAELSRGDIVLITDGVHPTAAENIKNSLPRGYRLSILGVGTRSGAPIPADNAGFLRDANDQIIIASLNDTLLANLADYFDGRYRQVTSDNEDIEALSNLATLPFSAKITHNVQTFDSEHDAGYWLVLLLLPVAAYTFRRHLIWAILPLAIIPQDSYAWSWTEFWFSNDQQAMGALKKGNTEQAAKLFEHPQWKAIAHYRNGNYQQAAQIFSKGNTADDLYNLGNSEALSGNLERAVTAFDSALALDSSHADALYNRNLLQAIIHQRKDDEEEEEQREEENNRRGSGGGTDDGESTDTDTSAQTTSGSEQQKLGGTAGGTESLNQQALQNGGQSSSSPGEQEPVGNNASDATPVQQSGAITSRLDGAGTVADSSALEIEDSESTVLNPYSEQWLRTLPKDPGGYMRRKFQYQATMRLQENGGEELPVQEGRY